MSQKFTLTVILILLIQSAFGQLPGKSGSYQFVKDVDATAEYPGGMSALYEYFKSQLRYPVDAQVKGVEGKTYIQFIVDSSGYIIPNSVITLKSLFLSCDAEAVRVIRSCKTQWKPAMKKGTGVNQQFVLPIAFAPWDADPLHPIEYTIRTVVVRKTFRSQDTTAWTLYSDPQTQLKSGAVLVGDTVEVTGWAPWAYYVQTDKLRGYISWKALQENEELVWLSKIVAEQSSNEYKPREYKKDRPIDPASRFAKPNAFLSVTTSAKALYAGECTTLTLAFNVHPENRAPLQFYELGQQAHEVISTRLTPDNWFIISHNVEDIVGFNKLIDDVAYTTYPIYKGSYCPINTGTTTIPAVNLRMAKVKAAANGTDSILTFTSKPISIKVNPLPPEVKPSLPKDYPLVGQFGLTDSLLTENINAGEPVIYKVTIAGAGLTFPVDPPKIKIPNVSMQLRDILDAESWIGEMLQSKKTFVYQLVFEKPGVYDFKGKIAFNFFNPRTEITELLKSTAKVNVGPAVKDEIITLTTPFGSKNNFIAIDASQSMQIEDYFPNRLSAVKNGLKKFLMDKKDCDIGLILFGGDAKHYTLAEPDKCYTISFIDSISFSTNRGTAIGEAIWLAKNSFANSTLPKKLVIIGDGDNTAGSISPKLAATLAKKYNFKIYTIGVGSSGLVPFGRDEQGRPNMIENTFTDKDLKLISSITGGQYYWAKDETEISLILKMIFGE
jgi:hypothetical protein